MAIFEKITGQYLRKLQNFKLMVVTFEKKENMFCVGYIICPANSLFSSPTSQEVPVVWIVGKEY
jgi:hypothetical protein